jgi:hypothetical protein
MGASQKTYMLLFFGYRDTGMDLTPYLYLEIKLFTVKTLKQIQYDKFCIALCVLPCLTLHNENCNLSFTRKLNSRLLMTLFLKI